MSDAPTKNDPAAPIGRGVRVLAVFTWLVIGLIAGATLYQTLADYFERAAIPARTVGGIAVTALSAVTTLAAILLLLTFRRFGTLAMSLQIAVGIVAPLGSLILIGLFMVVGWKFSSPILPLPFTPTVTLQFDDSSAPQVTITPSPPIGASQMRYDGIRKEFEYECFLGYFPGSSWPLRGFVYSPPNAPKQSLVKMSGLQSANQEEFAVTIQFTTSETVNLVVDGVAEAEITLDDKPIGLPAEIQPGSYKLTITGRQKPERENGT